MRFGRYLGALVVAFGTIFAVGGCLFVRAPEAGGPALVVGNLIGAVGDEVEIPVEVVGFPDPGVGGVAVLSLRYDPSVVQFTEIRGANGFVILCHCIDNENGVAKFAGVYPDGGLTTGKVATLHGIRLGLGDPRFSLSPGDLQVISGANLPFTGYAIRLGSAPLYSVRR